MSTATFDVISSYIPHLVARKFGANPRALTGPEQESFSAAVLFVDIAGFTALTERLTGAGGRGTEDIAHVLNRYFGPLIEIVLDHGGDVVKFAGDALLAIWRSEDASLAGPALAAAACGLAIQSQLDGFDAGNSAQLSCRIAVDCGVVEALYVGGAFERWELLIAGEPLRRLGPLAHEGQPGDVILGENAAAAASAEVLGTRTARGSLKLERVLSESDFAPLAPPEVLSEAEAALWRYIPAAIRGRIQAGQTDWLAELRSISVIFVNLPELDPSAPGALDATQSIMRALQSAVYRFEGSINKISVDDKGAMLVGVLGLPPLTHEDDPVRGVMAAMAIREKLRSMNIPHAVGVSSGRAFCGSIGSPYRREYTVMGNTVNLAARLMQASPNDVLCDEATFQAASQRVEFETLPPIEVRGRSEPQLVFRPLAIKQVDVNWGQLFGRERELSRISSALDDLAAGQSRIVVVSGEPGIGKSHLVLEALKRARARGMTTLVRTGDATQRTMPYHAWRPIFAQLFDAEVLTDGEAIRAQVLDELQAYPEAERMAPLLNAVLPLDLDENDVTAELSGQARADATLELLTSLLGEAATLGSESGHPMVMALEDAHWFDSASWALTYQVARRVRPLLLLLATRPLIQPAPREYSQLIEMERVDTLHLEPLGHDAVRHLVASRLGVARLPEEVADVIEERGGGHPFFSQELAYSMRDSGLIGVADGACALLVPPGELFAAQFPVTVQGVISSRIDRLKPPQQLALKVASVIGTSFPQRVLNAVHPVAADREHLSLYLEDLVQLDFTALEAIEPERSYVFKHALTQEVAYEGMLFAQRQQLHRRVAEWYESAYEDDLDPYFGVLAHHWSRADAADKAVHYLGLAGEQAFQDGAYKETVFYLSAALSTDAESGDVVTRARWHRMLSEAYYGLGDAALSVREAEMALRLLGKPLNHGRMGSTAGFAAQLGIQAAHRARGMAGQIGGAAPDDRNREILDGHEQLALSAYFADRPFRFLDATLRGLNIAETIAPTPALTRFYASVGLAAGTAGLRKLAERYLQLARFTVQQVDDQAARAWVSQLSAMHWSSYGMWKEARTALEESRAIYAELSERRRWEEVTGLFSLAITASAASGDELTQAARLGVELFDSALRRGDVQTQLFGLMRQSQSLLVGQSLAAAIGVLEQAPPILARSDDPHYYVETHGTLAYARLLSGDVVAAAREADEAISRLQRGGTTPRYYFFPGHGYLAGVCLSLAEQKAGTAAGREWMAKAEIAVKRLDIFKHFPGWRPRLVLYRSWLKWLQGRESRARRSWLTALDSAQSLGMPHDELLITTLLANHLPADDPRRQALRDATTELERQLAGK